MTFSTNNLSKVYWSILLIGLTLILLSIDAPGGKSVFAIIYVVLIALAIRSFSYKVNVTGRKITTRTLFTENSISIRPESRIYIRKNIASLFFLYRHYDYKIKIINPKEKLNINANVNDADALFELIAQLEQKIIFPVSWEHFSTQKKLRLDQDLTIHPQGITYKDKDYLYRSLSNIELEQGYFRLKAEGKMWETTVLALPISQIPNLTTFMLLVHHDLEPQAEVS
ncbi:hypothetical protein AY606_08605 [Acinetobacter sp. SFB]|uniref:DUF6585 family protein n=1 Tax=Acinetobacter sp. SFB TaxID=1805634 RepID=UPI0007D851E6|nr:DUF6585 family protein [Acinetobacter sp. SFB]OAL78474.1 hypothetical protein AY606_08605 [Acinetobacter sp. SFB]